MPTFERVNDDGEVVERRHVPYRSRDLPALEKSAVWVKVSEGYVPAADARPRPSVEDQRAARAETARTRTKKTTDGGG